MKSKIYILAILLVFVIGLFGNTAFAATNQAQTNLNIENVPPSFTYGPSDGPSSVTAPTNAGSNVTFTAIAHDNNADPYYLAVCKTDNVAAHNSTSPTCPDGTWAISPLTDSDAPASTTYPTSSSDVESNDWYAFVCDNNSSGMCSDYDQGTGDAGSPFKVNHRPSFTDVKIGPTCGSNSSINPGNGRSVKVITDFGNGDDGANSVAIQPDGKIVVSGTVSNGDNNDFGVVRYNADGTLDTDFGTGGKAITDFGNGDDGANSVAIQPDGKILTAGWSYIGTNYDFGVIRYNADGTLDDTFDGDTSMPGYPGNGKVTTDFGFGQDKALYVGIQSDGKIVVSGEVSNGSNSDFGVARYNADGTLDDTFDGDTSMPGYPGNGKVTTDFGGSYEDAKGLAIQTDGKIVAVGYSNNGGNDHFAVVRYNTNGTLDTDFGTGGKVTTAIGSGNSVAYSAAINTNGKIVVAGWYNDGVDYDFALARYNTDGSLDDTFNGDTSMPGYPGNGKVTTDFSGIDADDANFSVAIQSDGKIVTAGFNNNVSYGNFAVARYNTDGSLDTTFSGNGKAIVDFGSDSGGSYLVLQSNGKIVVAGEASNGSDYDFALTRLNPDGSLDNLSDYICIQATVNDSDIDTTTDTVDMYVCSTNSFVGGTCADTTLCTATGTASGSNAQCTIENMIPVPTPHGDYHVYVFVKDNHGFDGTGNHDNIYTVADVPPVVVSYDSITPPVPTAGGSDSISFTATINDDNGYTDITGITGVFFDSSAISLSSGTCTASDNNCILDGACTLNAGSGNERTATCHATVWYNADYSSGWKGHMNPSDQTTTVTNSIDSSGITNPSLLGIEVVEANIAYATVAIGGTSVSQATTMENKGNQTIDVLIDGDRMCTSGCANNIPVGQQKWSSSSTFDWDTQGNALMDTASMPSASTGCYNADIAVRGSDHTSTATDLPIFWKLRIPSSQKTGSYSGQNTFTSASGDTCTGQL